MALASTLDAGTLLPGRPPLRYWLAVMPNWARNARAKLQQLSKPMAAATSPIVGKVLDYLDKKGLTENTLVVYSSDQGFHLGEHGWFDKRFMYEESHHMPMLIRYPKRIKAGTIDRAIHNNTDFAPTILQEAGLSVPADMQGESFFSKKTRKSTYYHYYEYPAEHSVQTHFGIRTDRYKLIRFYKDGEFWELYDLQKDPEEMNNLYDKPAYRKIQNQLIADLKQLIRQYEDTEAAAILAKEERK